MQIFFLELEWEEAGERGGGGWVCFHDVDAVAADRWRWRRRSG